MRRTSADTAATFAGDEAHEPETLAGLRRWRYRFRARVLRRIDAPTSVLDRVMATHTPRSDAEVGDTNDADEFAGDDDGPDHSAVDAAFGTGPETAETTSERPTTPALRFGLVVILIVISALAALGGWFGFHAYTSMQVQRRESQLLDAGKAAAVNLTTINYTDADADVKRILDSATGHFADDFRTRSRPFIAMVTKVQSATVGTVAQAGLESVEGDKGRVLVAVSVKTTLGSGAEQPARIWRMRIEVQKIDNVIKVSNVEFVP